MDDTRGRHACTTAGCIAADLAVERIGLFPRTITSSSDGRLAYVACAVSSTVDLETLDRLARLDIAKLGEPGAHGLAYRPRPA
ncbi:hypothetical protein ACH4M4_26440 [Streptomyces sp. NPDC017254]|uniref:hypothetical protein n=1 Tax=unclassified Streptomyces TaxID=2593676 RepID=UPI00378DA1AB